MMLSSLRRTPLRAPLRWLRLVWHLITERDPQRRAMLRWRWIRGDSTLRIRYPLAASSVVIDAGGYRGDFAAAIVARYACTVHVFEPVPEYCEGLRRRFVAENRVEVHCAALGSSAGELTLSLAADGTSAFAPHHVNNTHARRVTVPLVDVVEFLRARKIHDVSLFKINIEGGEYELLDGLLNAGAIKQFANIQVQFHPWFPGAVDRRAWIRERLATTHDLSWDFPFIWESWCRRDSTPTVPSNQA